MNCDQEMHRRRVWNRARWGYLTLESSVFTYKLSTLSYKLLYYTHPVFTLMEKQVAQTTTEAK